MLRKCWGFLRPVLQKITSLAFCSGHWSLNISSKVQTNGSTWLVSSAARLSCPCPGCDLWALPPPAPILPSTPHPTGSLCAIWLYPRANNCFGKLQLVSWDGSWLNQAGYEFMPCISQMGPQPKSQLSTAQSCDLYQVQGWPWGRATAPFSEPHCGQNGQLFPPLLQCNISLASFCLCFFPPVKSQVLCSHFCLSKTHISIFSFYPSTKSPAIGFRTRLIGTDSQT